MSFFNKIFDLFQFEASQEQETADQKEQAKKVAEIFGIEQEDALDMVKKASKETGSKKIGLTMFHPQTIIAGIGLLLLIILSFVVRHWAPFVIGIIVLSISFIKTALLNYSEKKGLNWSPEKITSWLQWPLNVGWSMVLAPSLSLILIREPRLLVLVLGIIVLGNVLAWRNKGGEFGEKLNDFWTGANIFMTVVVLAFSLALRDYYNINRIINLARGKEKTIQAKERERILSLEKRLQPYQFHIKSDLASFSFVDGIGQRLEVLESFLEEAQERINQIAKKEETDTDEKEKKELREEFYQKLTEMEKVEEAAYQNLFLFMLSKLKYKIKLETKREEWVTLGEPDGAPLVPAGQQLVIAIVPDPQDTPAVHHWGRIKNGALYYDPPPNPVYGYLLKNYFRDLREGMPTGLNQEGLGLKDYICRQFNDSMAHFTAKPGSPNLGEIVFRVSYYQNNKLTQRYIIPASQINKKKDQRFGWARMDDKTRSHFFYFQAPLKEKLSLKVEVAVADIILKEKINSPAALPRGYADNKGKFWLFFTRQHINQEGIDWWDEKSWIY